MQGPTTFISVIVKETWKGKDAGLRCPESEFDRCDVSHAFSLPEEFVHSKLRNEAHIGSIPNVLYMAL